MDTDRRWLETRGSGAWATGLAVGTVVSLAVGAALIRRRPTGASATSGLPASKPSPEQLLDQCRQACENAKAQLEAQLGHTADPSDGTPIQMAINALGHCIAQCHTARGVLH